MRAKICSFGGASIGSMAAIKRVSLDGHFWRCWSALVALSGIHDRGGGAPHRPTNASFGGASIGSMVAFQRVSLDRHLWRCWPVTDRLFGMLHVIIFAPEAPPWYFAVDASRWPRTKGRRSNDMSETNTELLSSRAKGSNGGAYLDR